ncbi:MAG: IS200/IS605 family transposase [Acidobacteriota bacterium]|nr:IS200/IS605 family transposase [Acidobacteriota bacterium]MDQ5836166.1 IS200/IS605 family transposase [Acidobacteriota bacterium]
MPQSLSSILVHLVFSTKHREPYITLEIESELHAYLAAVFRECHSPALTINGTENHVHTLFVLSRTVTVAELVEEVKKRSSKLAKTKGGSHRNFQWQAGYGAFSIGQSNVQALKRYIAEQKEHHRRRTFEEEYRGFLEKYGVDYDERYVWD